VLTALNWTGTRISGDSQIVFSVLKGVALMALILLLFSHPSSPSPAAGKVTAAVGIAGFAIAMRVIISTYDGWQDTVYHCEELEQPERTLPRAMATGIIGVAILYLLVNLALLHVLSPAQMAMSNLPAADAANSVIGNMGELALSAFGVLSVTAITNLNVMRAARVPFAMARDGHLPLRLSYVAKSGTPRAALLASTILAAVFAATGTYETIVAMNVALNQALVIAVNVAAMRLRQKEPGLARSFRIPVYPLPVILAVVINLALLAALIYEDPLHSLEGFALLAIIGTGYALRGSARRRAAASAA
jgi:APA family basic amino acid/polyamine antiporter